MTTSIRAIFLFTAVTTLLATHGECVAESLSVNGIELHYEVTGDGEPLVLLHNFTQSGEAWKGVADDFAMNFQLIIPDLRGHGGSTNPSGQFTHRQAALDIFALLDYLEIEEFKAMGMSSGGMTLMHMATQQPERISSMVLIGATSHFPTEARQIMRETDPDNVSQDRMDQFREVHKHGDDQIYSILRMFNSMQDSYDDMNFTASYLSTIKAETLIVHGERDSFFSPTIAMEMYKAIPNSFLWIVPNGGHIPIYGKFEENFSKISEQFLLGQMVPRSDKNIE